MTNGDKETLERDINYKYFSNKNSLVSFRSFLDKNLNQLLEGMSLTYSLKEVDIEGVHAAWIEAEDCSKKKGVIIYLHGGCYVYGNITNYCTIPVQLANATGLKVLSVNYGLAPENPFPKALEDVIGVYEYLLNAGYQTENIAIVGDSAGGGLALSVVLKLKDLKIPLPAALGLFSPWVDLTLKGDTIHTLKTYDTILSKEQLEGAAAMYAGTDKLSNPFISPIFADYQDFPPMMIIAGGREILLSDAMNLVRKATLHRTSAHLVVWDNLYHVFAADSNLPESKEAMGVMSTFLLDKVIIS